MNYIKLLFAMLCVALGVAACTPEPDDVVAKSEIKILATEFQFSERGGTESVSYEIVNPISGESIVAVTEAGSLGDYCRG